MTKRNCFLDFLRCAAIVSVIFCHLAPTDHNNWLHVFKLGGRGVDLFFVLSGWLLGEQLFLELKGTGSIDVRRFLFRRWLRTLPAYYAVLFTVYAWQVIGRHNYNLDWTYLYFGQTYLSSMPYFGISWSLCVEEHFYLLIAPLLLLLFRRPGWIWFAPIFFFLPLVCRICGFYESTDQTHVRFDQCAVGVALAGCKVLWPSIWQKLCKWALPIAGLGFGTFISQVVLYLRPDGSRIPNLEILGWGLVFGSFVLLGTSSPAWSGAMNYFPIKYLATRAYSLYLMHTDAIAVGERLHFLPAFVRVIVVLGLSLVLAEILYRLIERPFMSLREKFAITAAEKPTFKQTKVDPEIGLMASASSLNQ